MSRFVIVKGPDRLAFLNSVVADMDATPLPDSPGRPHSLGGNIPPSYRGETFIVTELAGPHKQEEQVLLLIISKTGRKNVWGRCQLFEAVLWSQCEEFAHLNHDPLYPWVHFHGLYDFGDETGWLAEKMAPVLSR